MREKFFFWLAWKLPRRLVYWCAIRLIARATTGDWGHTIVPELTAMGALRRWDENYTPAQWLAQGARE